MCVYLCVCVCDHFYTGFIPGILSLYLCVCVCGGGGVVVVLSKVAYQNYHFVSLLSVFSVSVLIIFDIDTLMVLAILFVGSE